MKKNISDIGLIGLGVMGRNLSLNIASHGFKISVFNRTVHKTNDFILKHKDIYKNLLGFQTIYDFIQSIIKPRKIILLVESGNSTNIIIEQLLLIVDKGDIIIDAGNSHWADTIEREKRLLKKNIFFIGSGVSGGAEGARFGPSLMPGGSIEAWKQIEFIWSTIAAKVDNLNGKLISNPISKDINPNIFSCSKYIGENGSGHYVKMIHNGIEYGEMQIICEAYDIMRKLLNMSAKEISDVFASWNNGVLNSFLVEITSNILKEKDNHLNKPYIDFILDIAGQKGTGAWTSINSLTMNISSSVITQSVFARYISTLKDERLKASQLINFKIQYPVQAKKDIISAIHDAVYCSKIITYAEGFTMMKKAETIYNWKLNFREISKIWRGGCIIRGAILQKINESYEKNTNLQNLIIDPYFKNFLEKNQKNWRFAIETAMHGAVPVPALMAALSYFDSYCSNQLPQNLIQAQRNYFGDHMFERIDSPKGNLFNHDWNKNI